MRHTSILILFTTIFFALSAKADRGFAIKAMAHANASLMASPVLPSLQPKENDWSFSFRPAFFEAESYGAPEGGSGSGYDREINYSGYGFAGLAHYQWTDHWGLFLSGMGNRINGNFSTTTSNQGTPLEVNADNVESFMTQLTLGVTWSLFKRTYFPLQFFAGPSYIQTKLDQTVTSNTGDDFDMSMNPSALGYFAGVQFGAMLGDWVALNPYFILGGLASSDDKCQRFTATTRSTGNFWDFSDPACQMGENSSTSRIEYDTTFSAVGVNFLVPRWGIGINLFSETGDIPGYDGVELELYYITISF